ncbi:profilin, required for normal timing of actin polymerization in response to thermal stress [Entomophthora muscae]|uniref:Profilin, required for normal timing of actin polymerization in response to thermal stress n=2 Tax=Entomophthora muscae TaxID=34485 RepID=A0ACC2ST71_9FUNG|nr:profilin, required for normal timing of actin polymerization in response to thermal stress [Entomophthora muscae]KAJ9071902.1 profilin, required for normal timing of actin polymerization in response to thermal stress [Entomophthora muscae]
MSWQAFVDTNLVGSGHLSQAAIFGHDKNVWAKSNERFQVKPAELDVILSAFEDAGEVYSKGFHVLEKRYVTIKCDSRSLYGKAADNDGGIVCVKTNQTLIVAVYPADIKSELASVPVETLADQLIEVNY